MANWYLEQSLRALQRRRLRQRLAPGPEQRGRLRQQLLRRHRLHPRHRTLPRRPGERLVRRADRTRARARPTSTRCSPRSTSGIATTTTATATSTSPTATSTTSSRSTPARVRRPAAAPRAPMPSGAIARMPTPARSRHRRARPWMATIVPFGGLPIACSEQVDRRLHDRARERWRRRVLARVRP